MTVNQEDALYDFLRNVTEPFTLDDICAFVRMVEPKKSSHLNTETASFLDQAHGFSAGRKTLDFPARRI